MGDVSEGGQAADLCLQDLGILDIPVSNRNASLVVENGAALLVGHGCLRPCPPGSQSPFLLQFFIHRVDCLDHVTSRAVLVVKAALDGD